MIDVDNAIKEEVKWAPANFAQIIVLSDRTENLNYLESVMNSFGCKCDIASTDIALMDQIVKRTQSMVAPEIKMY